MKYKIKNLNSQKGVSLIMVFFIMLIILAIVFGISAILYGEIKVARNIGDSVTGFYAADSGIEKVLYYDRNVFPTSTDENGVQTIAKRGLCVMYPYYPSVGSIPNSTWVDPFACADSTQINIDNPDSSIFCQAYGDGVVSPQVGTTDFTDGCDPNVCDDCKISFSSTLDNGAKYYTTATVSPSQGSSDFRIDSRGTFNQAERQVEVLIRTTEISGAIKIINACANPNSVPEGTSLTISANVIAGTAGDTIGDVTATITDSQGNYYDENGNSTTIGQTAVPYNITLAHATIGGVDCPSLASCDWSKTWTTANTGAFTVNLVATDNYCDPENTLCTNNTQTCTNLSSDTCVGECSQ